MKIALIGYGKMGKRIHQLCPAQGHQVELVVIGKTNPEGAGITPEKFEGIDVAIDFSHPDAARTNILKLMEIGVPVVVGTTGWLTPEDDFAAICLEKNGRVLYGSNFSLGVQLFLKLVHRAGELFGKSGTFEAAIHETHHTQKADAPSGTAKTLAQRWLAGAGKPETPLSAHIPEKGLPQEGTLYVTSQRVGNVIGEHELRLRSEFDDIRISHHAQNRDAFAFGAIRSAAWLIDQEPGFYLIEDVVESVLG